MSELRGLSILVVLTSPALFYLVQLLTDALLKIPSRRLNVLHVVTECTSLPLNCIVGKVGCERLHLEAAWRFLIEISDLITIARIDFHLLILIVDRVLMREELLV